MRQACQVIAAILLVVWVPSTLHCQLERLPGLGSFLSCCQHEDAQSPAHHEEECAMDNCADLESGLYQLPQRAAVPAAMPALQLVWLRDLRLTDRTKVDREIPLPSSPPLLSSSWRFVTRAASGVRAPSSAS